MSATSRTLALFLFSVLASSALFAQETSLPGNATSLRETHGDWTVSCAIVASPDGATRRCALSQQQVAQQTRQRALAIELRVREQDAQGTIVLPFGLQLDQGVVLSIDDAEFLAPLRFSTCVPAGCLVPLEFNAGAISALRAGSVLSVRVATSDTGQEMVFSISLTGFSNAYDRVAALLAP